MKIKSINSQKELESVDPENVKFHITYIVRMLIKYLPFTNVDEERVLPHLTGPDQVIACPACGAAGWVWDREFLFTLIPLPARPVRCPRCNGTGRLPDNED